MFSKIGVRIVATIVAASMVCGCAELDRRGGIVAEIQDNVLFIAHTKSHRLFRSYMLIGVLLAAARQGAHNQADAAAIEGNLKSALSISFEAYQCLYGNARDPNSQVGSWVKGASTEYPANTVGSLAAVAYDEPAICQFFDEKMARLDYALFRMALSTLFNAQSNVYLAEIRDKLLGEIPVVSATAKAAIYTNKAANQVTNIVDDLLNLSFSSAGPVLTLLPLYRDSLEMNMWVIVDSLTRACGLTIDIAPPAFQSDGMPVPKDGTDCAIRDYAYYILNKGNGYLPVWREFVRQMNYRAANVEAYTPHFVLVSRLIWRSCRNLLLPEDCAAVMKAAADRAGQEALFVHVIENDRVYSASVNSPTRFARRRTPAAPVAAVPPNVIAAPTREGEPTGSINQAKPAAPAAPPAR
jgi:hypothetical protein